MGVLTPPRVLEIPMRVFIAFLITIFIENCLREVLENPSFFQQINSCCFYDIILQTSGDILETLVFFHENEEFPLYIQRKIQLFTYVLLKI